MILKRHLCRYYLQSFEIADCCGQVMAEVQSRESVLSVTGELTGTLASLHSDAQARDAVTHRVYGAQFSSHSWSWPAGDWPLDCEWWSTRRWGGRWFVIVACWVKGWGKTRDPSLPLRPQQIMKTSWDHEIHDGNSEVQSEKTSFAIPAILWFVCALVQTSDSVCANRFLKRKKNKLLTRRMSFFWSDSSHKVLAYDSLPAALEASTSLGGALRAVAARAVFVGFLLAARDGVRGKPGKRSLERMWGWDGGETTKRFKSNSKWNSFSPLFANLSTMFMLIMLSEWHDMLVAKLEAVHVHVRWASKLRLLQCMNVFLSPSNRCSLHQFYGCAQSQAQTNASSLSSLGFSQMELHKWFEDDDRCHFIIWRYVSSIIGIGQLWVGVRISVMIM